jgi:energy-coupling factor transporter ATP-binding protein EcfA2
MLRYPNRRVPEGCSPVCGDAATAGTPQRFGVNILGLPATVVGDPQCLGLLSKLLAPFSSRTGADPCAAFRLLRDGRYVVETMTLCTDGTCEAVANFCEWFLVAQAAIHRCDYLQLHGGAVQREGQLILLPGLSGSGKTTLTLGMMARGFLPLTDDLILIDPQQGTVRPFERCFHIDASTLAIAIELGLSKKLILPEALAEGFCRPRHWGVAGVPTCIVLPRYAPGAQLALNCLRPAQAWIALANLCMVTGKPSVHYSALSRLVEKTPTYQITYSDLSEAVETIIQLTQ